MGDVGVSVAHVPVRVKNLCVHTCPVPLCHATTARGSRRRCGSTQLLCLSVNWALVTDAVGGSIRAHKMRTPLNVDNRYTIAMATVNGVCMLIVLGVLAVSAWSKTIRWPAPSPATATARSMTSKERRGQYCQGPTAKANARARAAVSPAHGGEAENQGTQVRTCRVV